MGLTDFVEREELKLMTLEYSIEDEGSFLSEPIVELFCRDADGNKRVVEVEGFYPSFYITEDEYQEKEDDIFSESMIRSVVARAGVTSIENEQNVALEEVDESPRETLEGEPLVKIYTVVPSHAAELKDSGVFEETWEADIFFTNRFLIDSGIKLGLTIPAGEERVHYDQIEPSESVPDVQPRVVTIDIEVWSGGEFPNTQNAVKPVTAVTVHDSYDDEYRAGILHPESSNVADNYGWLDTRWQLPDGIENCEIEVFHESGREATG